MPSSYSVTINAGANMSLTQGSSSQSNIAGDMESVTYTAAAGYNFPEDYAVSTKNGITVTRKNYKEITVSGTPAGSMSIIINLPDAVQKASQNAPIGLSDGINSITGTTINMEYSSDRDAVQWLECGDGSTSVGAGTWYVRYKETDTKCAGSAATVVVAVRYNVSINEAENMTKRADSGDAVQSNVAGAIQPVTYEAVSGYYFPDGYTVEAVHGISVVRDNAHSITVSGTPDGDANITLTAAMEKSSQNAPENLSAGKGRILNTTVAMEYTDNEDIGTWLPCTDGKTRLEVGTWYVRMRENDSMKASAAVSIEVSEPDNNIYSVSIESSNHKMLTYCTGNLIQNNLTGDMEPVFIEADAENYFPEDYSVPAVNGITVTRESNTRIKISGKPNDDTVIILPEWTSKTVPEAPEGLKNGIEQILGTTKAMEYCNYSDATKTYQNCGEGSTIVPAGKYLVRYRATETSLTGERLCITISAKNQVVNPVTQYATAKQLTRFELGSRESVEGRIKFGKDIEWLIAGSDDENSITLYSTVPFCKEEVKKRDTKLAELSEDAAYFSESDKAMMQNVSVSYFDNMNSSVLDNQKLYLPNTASAYPVGDTVIYAGKGDGKLPIDSSHWPYYECLLRSMLSSSSSTTGKYTTVNEEKVSTCDDNQVKHNIIPAVNIDISNVTFAAAVPITNEAHTGNILPTDAMTMRMDAGTVIKNSASVIYTAGTNSINISNGDGCTLVIQSNDSHDNWYYTLPVTGDEQTVYLSQIQTALNDNTVKDLSKCKIWIEKTEDGVTYAKSGESVCNVTVSNPADSHMTRRETSGEETQSVTGRMNTIIYEADDGYCFAKSYNEQAVKGVDVIRKSNSIIEVSGAPEYDINITLEGAVKKIPSRTVALGNNGISMPNQSTIISQWTGDRIIFGNQSFRVLEDSGILLSDNIIKKAGFNNENLTTETTWTETTLYSYLNNDYIDCFTPMEQQVLQSYTAKEGSTIEECGKVFLLSDKECTNKLWGFTGPESRCDMNGNNMSSGWWLRTISSLNQAPSFVGSNGAIELNSNISAKYDGFGVRPALDIDMDKISFTSVKGTDKSRFGLTSDKDTYNTWCVDLVGGTGFAAQLRNNDNLVEAGSSMPISITNIGSSNNGVAYSQLSAMIADKDGIVYAYGQISDSAKKGDVEVTIPDGISDGEYTLYVFAEDVNTTNDSYATDYASNMSSIDITVGDVPAALVSITAPAAVNNVPHGTSVDAIAAMLPSHVSIVTDDESINSADVIWNLDNIEYDVTDLKAQHFEVAGTITLPSNVNQDNKSLTTSIEVNVKAADTVANVTSSLLNGTYTSNQKITLNTLTDGAKIYYTTDGSEPGLTNGECYTDSILLSGEAGSGRMIILKAAAFKDNMQQSEVSTFTYLINIPEKTYSVIVNDGSGDGAYRLSSMVTIKADKSPDGYAFSRWDVKSGEVILINSDSETAVFSMTAGDVEISAVYECTHPTTELRGAVAATYEKDGYTGDTYCTLCGEKIADGEVIPKLNRIDISTAVITGVTSVYYNGKAQTQPKLKLTVNDVELISGADYTVKYKDNKYIGTASITITGTGIYTGTFTKSFSIKIKKNASYTVGGMKYKVTNSATNGKGTVSLVGTTSSKAKLKTLVVGSRVKIGGKYFLITSIGSKAFKGYKALKNIDIRAKKLKTIGKNAIAGISKSALIKVPSACVKSYRKLFGKTTGFVATMNISK